MTVTATEFLAQLEEAGIQTLDNPGAVSEATRLFSDNPETAQPEAHVIASAFEVKPIGNETSPDRGAQPTMEHNI